MEPPRLDGFKNFGNLPSPPSQMSRVLDEIGRTSAMDYNITRMIQYDPSIACRVLRVANDPLYGYHRQIASLQQASGLLGPGVIKNAILTTPLLEQFARDDSCQIDYSRIWLHSSVTAAIAGCLGRFVRNMESDVCFTAGLIHDIGKIALAVYHPAVFYKLFDLAGREKIALIEAERKMLGFCHFDIASTLMTQWGFPSALVEAVENCSRSISEVTDKLTAVIRLAKSLAIDWGYSNGMESHFPLQYDVMISALGISKENLETWKPELREYADFVVHSCEK